MSTTEYQKYLRVVIPDPDLPEDEMDVLQAMPIEGHGRYFGPKWLLGHECSGTYVHIYHDEIDSWIEILNEMKNYTFEEDTNGSSDE